jgi:hypothetical protein
MVLVVFLDGFIDIGWPSIFELPDASSVRKPLAGRWSEVSLSGGTNGGSLL